MAFNPSAKTKDSALMIQTNLLIGTLLGHSGRAVLKLLSYLP
jgi:hypothetical protein